MLNSIPLVVLELRDHISCMFVWPFYKCIQRSQQNADGTSFHLCCCCSLSNTNAAIACANTCSIPTESVAFLLHRQLGKHRNANATGKHSVVFCVCVCVLFFVLKTTKLWPCASFGSWLHTNHWRYWCRCCCCCVVALLHTRIHKYAAMRSTADSLSFKHAAQVQDQQPTYYGVLLLNRHINKAHTHIYTYIVQALYHIHV